jgi:iron complex transport system substrate-binding protein
VPVRIASLLPAATDIVCALGLEDYLVAATFECAIPERRRSAVAVVVGGVDTSSMTPAEIDAYVRTQAAHGGDLYTLHEGALQAAAPELVLTQDLCRVCAVDEGRVDVALRHLGCTADVVTLDPHTLEGILESIVAVGRGARAAARADQLVAALRARLDEVAARVHGLRRPRVAVIEWTDPVFGAGHWIPDIVRAAGGTPVGCHPGTRSAPTTWDAIARERPEVVIVAPCGFGLVGAAEQAAAVADRLPDAEVWAIDADALVVRPGPRVVEGVEAIAGVLHPDSVALRPDVVRLIQPPTRDRTDAGTAMPALRSGAAVGSPYDA